MLQNLVKKKCMKILEMSIDKKPISNHGSASLTLTLTDTAISMQCPTDTMTMEPTENPMKQPTPTPTAIHSSTHTENSPATPSEGPLQTLSTAPLEFLWQPPWYGPQGYQWYNPLKYPPGTFIPALHDADSLVSTLHTTKHTTFQPADSLFPLLLHTQLSTLLAAMRYPVHSAQPRGGERSCWNV